MRSSRRLHQRRQFERLAVAAPRLITILLCVIATAGVVWSAIVNSPSFDECGQFGAGLSHWRTGRLEAYHVNPPLPRLLQTAAAAIATSDEDIVLETTLFGPFDRSEWRAFDAVAEAIGSRVFPLVTVCRLVNFLPAAILVTAVFIGTRRLLTHPALARRSTEASRRSACWAAVAMTATAPTTLTAATLLTPDLFSMVVGAGAMLAVDSYCRRPTALAASVLGLAIGLAIAVKTTWLLLLPLWGVFAIASGLGRRGLAKTVGDAARTLGLALLCLNASYGFSGTGRPLSEFAFASDLFAGPPIATIRQSVLGEVPLPLPEPFVRGIDRQRLDFEGKYPSFFAGQTEPVGDRRFYLAVLVHKLPLAWLPLLLVGLASTIALVGGHRLWLFHLTPIWLIAAVSVNNGFTHHVRYVSPAVPLLLIVAAAGLATWRPIARAAAWGLLILGAAQAFAFLPQPITFLNGLDRFSGGRGSLFGVSPFDSTIDWNQDLLRARRWADEHPDIEIAGFAHNSLPAAVSAAGLPSRYPPERIPFRRLRLSAQSDPTGQLIDPGGAPVQEHWVLASTKTGHENDDRFGYLGLYEPTEWIGRTLFVYRVLVATATTRSRPRRSPAESASE